MKQILKIPINPSTKFAIFQTLCLNYLIIPIKRGITAINRCYSIYLYGKFGARVNTRKISEIFFYLFIFSLFFPVRYVFFTSTTLKTGIFSDFTSISLYLSDILLIITWFWLIISRGGILPRDIQTPPRGNWLRLIIKNTGLGIIIFVIWLILAIFLHIQTFSGLNAYYFLKFLELIVAYGTIRLLFQETSTKSRFLKLFAALGTIQAGLAIAQFYLQKPLGISLLGEQQIYAWNHGIAKLVVDGATYIRGYGTFPHPNLLSAYLLVTIFVLIFLLIQAKPTGKKLIYSLMLAGSVFGLIATFSRASFLALGAGLVVFFGVLLFRKVPKVNFVPLGTIFISLILAFAVFKPFLLTRTTVSDSASLQRIFYAKTGWQMIKAEPLFGMGIGESVLHMQQFSPIKLWPWQIQPIHNYFELAAADLGIIGALILIWIFLSHLKAISYMLKADFSSYHLLLATILVCFLILMMFDHYFYTLQQTQMLLWIILGAIAAETKKEHSRQ